jgi:hypothetical protein
MSLVPVNFSFANRTILEPNGRFALYLAPIAPTVQTDETTTIAKADSRCDRFHSDYLADDLELQATSD